MGPLTTGGKKIRPRKEGRAQKSSSGVKRAALEKRPSWVKARKGFKRPGDVEEKKREESSPAQGRRETRLPVFRRR